MFDLEKAIREWRAELMQEEAIHRESARELESHLRDEIDVFLAEGLSSEDAFAAGTRQLGRPGNLNEEFAKVHEAVPWQRRFFAALMGYTLITIVFYLFTFVRTLLEIICVTLGWTKALRLPEPIPVDQNSPFAGPHITTYEHISLVTVIAHAGYIASIIMVVLGVYLALKGYGRSRWMAIIHWFQDSRARLFWLVGLLGMAHVSLHLLTASRHFHMRPINNPKRFDIGMDPWVYMVGESYLLNLTFWILPLASFLIGLWGYLAYRRQRLENTTANPLATALFGYVLLLLTLYLALIIGGIGYTISATIHPQDYYPRSTLVMRTAEIVFVGYLGLGTLIAMKSDRFPSRRRLLSNLWNRPKTILGCWLVINFGLMPIALHLLYNRDHPFLVHFSEALLGSFHLSFFQGWQLAVVLTLAMWCLVLSGRPSHFKSEGPIET